MAEYEAIWGKNYTEWDLLRRTPRRVAEATIRHPHADIGYYNFLDYEHRQYMRVMADHFGIYGFCFAHYWYNGRALLHKAMDKMLEDDEPDKPFFVVWMNEPLRKRGDGSEGDVVATPQYDDDTDNEAHFKYLLKLFLHKNYISYAGMPVLALYDAPKEDVDKIEGLIDFWRELSIQAGYKGVHILRWFSNDRDIHGLDLFGGIIESEPSYYEIKEQAAGSLVSGWAYDKASTWRAIEDRTFRSRVNRDGRSNIRGTFWNFNDYPRWHDPDRIPVRSPKIHVPCNINGFEHHLSTFYWKVAKTFWQKVMGYAVFLTSWNIWSDQSMFEPNDVDGYDALSIVKKVFLTNTRHFVPRGTILHVARPMDYPRHVGDLQKVFGEYTHVFFSIVDAISDSRKYDMVHIHHPGLEITVDNIRQCKQRGIQVFITIHDYYWLYPPGADDYPTISSLESVTPHPGALSRAVGVLLMADIVLFPSSFVRSHYMKLPGLSEYADDFDRFTVVPPLDVLLNVEIIKIPEVSSFVSVGLIGDFTPAEGSLLFSKLAQSFEYVERRETKVALRYNVISKSPGCRYRASVGSEITVCSLTDHGKTLTEINPGPGYFHVLMILSSYPDPYSYDVTAAVNTGLPILYLDHGTLRERLSSISSPRFFPVKDPTQLIEKFAEVIKYTILNSGLSSGHEKSKNVQPSKWWLYNYPKRRTE